MNFDELKGLTSSGAQAAPVETPKPVAVAPAPASEPIASVADAATVHADPYAPVAAPVLVPDVKPASIPLPEGYVEAFARSGAFLGVLKPDGSFIRRTSELPSDPLSGVSEADKEPINWDDEQRLDLPQRTPGRVQFLLLHETKEQREARIQNDLMRGLKQHHADVVPFDKEKTAAADALKKWVQ
jgi:hypothetical protein